MTAYIIGMQKIVSLASQRKRVAKPRAEPDEASVKLGGKSFERNKLSHFDIGLLVRTVRRHLRPLRPLDRFFECLHLDNPVAGDQLLRFGEWSIDHRFLAAG